MHKLLPLKNLLYSGAQYEKEYVFIVLQNNFTY